MAERERLISLSTVFATASLLVSFVSLYFSNLAPPSIAMVAGPNIKVYYPADGGFGLYLPVAFVNSSAATGTIYKLGVSLTAKQPGADTFYFEWRNFTHWGNQVELDEPAHALAVQGNTSLAKIVWLTWRATSEPKLILASGDYTLAVHVWTKPTGLPTTQLHELVVDDGTASDLERERVNKQDILVDVTLDRQLPPNRHLTSFEATSLLGLPKI